MFKTGRRHGAIAACTATAVLFIAMAPSIAMAQAMTIDTSVLRGIWKEDARCNGPEVMAFDGSSRARLNGRTVDYVVTAPDEVTFSGPGGSVVMPTAMLGPEQMSFGSSPMRLEVTLQGTTGILYECGQSFAGGNQRPNPAPNNAGVGAAIAALGILGAIAGSSGQSGGQSGGNFRGQSGGQANRNSPAPALTETMMSAKWTETNNCAAYVLLDVFGGVSDANGNTTGTWTLSGNVLNIDTNGGGNHTATVRPISYNQLEVTSQGGAVDIWKRC